MSEDFFKCFKRWVLMFCFAVILTAVILSVWYDIKYQSKIDDLELELANTKAEIKALNIQKTNALEQAVRLYMMEVKAENELFKEVWVKGSPKESK